MTFNRKSISIILLIQCLTGLLVFALTRAYYQNQAAPTRSISPPPAAEQTDLTTDQLINSLKNHPGLDSLIDPIEIDRQANQAFQSGDYAMAAKLYQQVIDLAPHKVEPHNNLGLTLHYLGRSSEALTVLKRGAELDPNFQRVWLTLGFVQQGVGNITEAKTALGRAVELGTETQVGINAKELLDKLP